MKIFPSKSILVIEDEEDIQVLIKLALEIEANWKVTTTSSGEEGIILAEKQLPDAILLDVMMPGMDGLITFKQLQLNAKTQTIPVILLTAKTAVIKSQKWKHLGIKGAVSKPFDPLELASNVTQILGW